MINQWYEKWQSLSHSERRTIAIGGFVLLGILYYSVIISPLLKDKKSLKNRVQVEKQLYLDTKERVNNIYASGVIQKQSARSDMQQLIQKASAKYQLPPMTKKQGASWEINFTDVGFSSLIEWLNYMDNLGVRIEQFVISKDNNKDNYARTANIKVVAE